MYPRGFGDCSLDSKYISCGLSIQQKSMGRGGLTFRCRDHEKMISVEKFSCSEYFGVSNFLERKSVSPGKYLEKDGSSIIDCDIRVATGEKSVWYPKELQRQDTLVDLYRCQSIETLDICFKVGKVIHRAHRNILFLRGKKLYEITREYKNNAPIPIRCMRQTTFTSILEYIYTVKMPDIKNIDIAHELLVAADRYDLVHLKLYVESVIVDKFLTARNTAELLILSNSYSSALLKEEATNLFVSDPETVKSVEAWSKIQESSRLLTELLDKFAFSRKLIGGNRSGEIRQLDVTTIRKKLAEEDLALDGSRETLINRLNKHAEVQ